MSLNGLKVALKCQGHRVSVTRGETAYQPETGIIFVNGGDALGEDSASIARVLHEIGHAEQHRTRPWLFKLRHFTPVRYWLERDAWNRAEKIGWARFHMRAVSPEVRAGCLSTYGRILQ